METRSEIENDLSKVFVDNEEAKAFYKYIYLNITYNNEVEEKIIKNLNLDYFFIEKKDGKLKLKTFPFIKDIVMDISKEKIASLLNTQFFIKCDDYIKGGIIEDIAKEEIKNIFKMNAKNKNDFQEVDIHRLLDNEIYTLYTPEIVKLILKKKKNYQKIKEKCKKKNLTFKGKVTIFNIYQNSKHYDLGYYFMVNYFYFNQQLINYIN